MAALELVQKNGSPDELMTRPFGKLVSRVERFRQQLGDELLRARAATLAPFATNIRAQVERELIRRGQLTFDGILSRLAEKLQGEGPEGKLARAIRARYDAALVDEFQDTDSAQWKALETIFHGRKRLVLVGDPKQAIYGFRGADIHAYLKAKKTVDAVSEMQTNWRSDGPLIAALNHLFRDDGDRPLFGEENIRYVQIQAKHEKARWRGHIRTGSDSQRVRRPVELRWVSNPDTPEGLTKGALRPMLVEACANEVQELLGSDGRIEEEKSGAERPVEAKDIAVLVYDHEQAIAVREALRVRGIPSVTAEKRSVFQSSAARWIEAWLDAVASPGDETRARVAAVNPLFGWSPQQLAKALDAAPGTEQARRWESWVDELRSDAERWSSQGFVRVFEKALQRHDAIAGLLPSVLGERHATDVRHLMELLHLEERRTHVGPRGLASWLRTQKNETVESDTQPMRLETDAEAVSIATVWASKGLEYPIVLVPFACIDSSQNDNKKDIIQYYDTARGQRVIDLRPKDDPEREKSKQTSKLQSDQERMRLVYVALTRAKHHVVAWLAGGKGVVAPTKTAIGRLVFRSGEEGSKIPTSAQNVTATDYEEALEKLASSSGDTIGWSRQPEARSAPQKPKDGETESLRLEAAPWDLEKNKYFATGWRITSFSGLVGNQKLEEDGLERAEQRLAAISLSQGTGGNIEPTSDDENQTAGIFDHPGSVQTPSTEQIAFDGLRSGTEPGQWIHEVFEHLDFATGKAKDGRSLAELVAEKGKRYGILDRKQHEIAVDSLPGVLETPLSGGATGLPEQFTMKNIAVADRLDELAFDLRIGGGSRWRNSDATNGNVLNVALAREALSARLHQTPSWPGTDWLRHVLNNEHLLPCIAGIMTGFIDMVFRVPDQERPGRHRYYVVDYKTNLILSAETHWQSNLGYYTQPWLAWEMARHGYHLQSLIYAVALHRMLRQRLDDYDYDRDIGGHLYLFVRGMRPLGDWPDGALHPGVWSDRWPKETVEMLSKALDGASREDSCPKTTDDTPQQEVKP